MSEYYGYNCYIIDKTGKILVELDNVSYPSLDSDFRQGLAPVGNDDGWGYINKKGTFVIPANFKSAGPFMGDYAAASIKVRGQQFGEKFGYIDKRGEFVIEPKFDFAANFIDGVAWVQEGDIREKKYGIIDKKGYYILSPQYAASKQFAEGLAPAKIGGKWGYVNTTGTIVIEPKFDDAGRFAEGLAPAKIGGTWGYVNTIGTIVIEPKFTQASNFHEGFAVVNNGNQYCFIDLTGNLVVTLKFDMLHDFYEGLAIAKVEDKYGYIDKTGTFIIGPEYDYCCNFSEGVAIVCVKKNIDETKSNQSLLHNPQTSKPTQVNKPTNSGCYVATAVYGNYDCPEVWTLRRYRDNVMDNSWYGRLFIRIYYAISPTLVKWFGATEWFRDLFRAPLNRWVKKMNKSGFENTPYKDKY